MESIDIRNRRHAPKEIVNVVRALESELSSRGNLIGRRESRYRGDTSLSYASTDRLPDDLNRLNVNLCSLAVDVIAERMRVATIAADVKEIDISDWATGVWERSQLDQLLNGVLVDALALGSSYLVVWPDGIGRPRVSCESAHNVVVSNDPITGRAQYAIKRWHADEVGGGTTRTFISLFTPNRVVILEDRGGALEVVEEVPHALDALPVIPLVNAKRAATTSPLDRAGYSVIDDLAPLNDALNKVLADMLTASEDTARPRRWATGVDLEEDTAGEFSADGGFSVDDDSDVTPPSEVVSPFADGNRMFTVENENAKFGQLAGADLKGYQTAVDIIVQQIMAVSSLPAHMVGVTTSNPSSADAIRAAEAGLTSRAESRQSVFGIALEKALSLALSMETGYSVDDIHVRLEWAQADTRSIAQESDAVTKLHTLGIITTDEARTRLGIGR